MPWIPIVWYQHRPLTRPGLSVFHARLPLICKLTHRINTPVCGPDFVAPAFGATNSMDMVRHVRERDKGFLRLPDRECAASNGTLEQEGIAYQSCCSPEVSSQSTIRQEHREHHPEMPQTKSRRNAHHLITPLSNNTSISMETAMNVVFPF